MPYKTVPNNKVHGANMGPILVQQAPDGSHVGPMNFAIWGLPLRILLILSAKLFLVKSSHDNAMSFVQILLIGPVETFFRMD